MTTCFAAVDQRLRRCVVDNLIVHMRDVRVHTPSVYPYADPLRDDARFCATLPSAIAESTAILYGLTGQDPDEFGSIDDVIASKKPCVLLVKSADPAVYRRLGEIHNKARFRAVVAVGGPSRVESFFPGTKVLPVFDLEHGTCELARHIQEVVDGTG